MYIYIYRYMLELMFRFTLYTKNILLSKEVVRKRVLSSGTIVLHKVCYNPLRRGRHRVCTLLFNRWSWQFTRLLRLISSLTSKSKPTLHFVLFYQMVLRLVRPRRGITCLDGSRSCHLPFRLVESPVAFDHGPFVELDMEDCHRTWQKIINMGHNKHTYWI